MADAAFNVVVEPQPEPNHLLELVLDTKRQRFEERPALLARFVQRIADRLHGSPAQVLVDSLEAEGGRTLLRWSNGSLSRGTCERKEIDALEQGLAGGKARLRDFAKFMGADFAVREVSGDKMKLCRESTQRYEIGRGILKKSRGIFKKEKLNHWKFSS